MGRRDAAARVIAGRGRRAGRDWSLPLTRSERHIRLNTAVDAQKYRDLLRAWGRLEARDSGEE